MWIFPHNLGSKAARWGEKLGWQIKGREGKDEGVFFFQKIKGGGRNGGEGWKYQLNSSYYATAGLTLSRKGGVRNNTSGDFIWIYKVPTQKKQDHQSLFPGLALLLHIMRRQALLYAPFNPAQ